MSLTPGAAHGPFSVLEPIGSGSLGESFAAHDSAAGRDVTLDVVPADLASDPARLAELRRTVDALTALDHPNVIRFFGLASTLEPPVVVSEPARGLTVTALVRAHGISGARSGEGASPLQPMPRIGLPLTEALLVAHQVARGMEAIHAGGVVHGRLHPAIVRIGTDGVIKIGGFGLVSSRAGDPDTVSHWSPEQVRGLPADRRSDVWAFGVLIYEMLAGVGPFVTEHAAGTEAAVLRGDPEWSALPLDTPLAVRRLLRACLEKKPDARPADLASARRALEDYLASRAEFDVARVTAGGVDAPSAPTLRGTRAATHDTGRNPRADTPARRRAAFLRDPEAAPIDDGSAPTPIARPGATRVAHVDNVDHVDHVDHVDPVDRGGHVTPVAPAMASVTPATASVTPANASVTPANAGAQDRWLDAGVRRHDGQGSLAEPDPPAADSPAVDEGPPGRRRGDRRRLSLVAALLVGAVGSGTLLWWLRPPVPDQTSRYVISVPPSAPLDVDADSNGQLAISPDGRLVAYTTHIDGQRRVYLRRTDALEGEVVSDVRNPETLFFSPDGAWLGYASADGEWSKVPVGHGDSHRITSRLGESRGASWGADGSIVFAERRSGLFRVSDAGGVRQALTTPDLAHGETGHYWPSIVPGGRAVLFSIVGGPNESQATIAALDLDTKTIRRLVPSGRSAQYAPSGHLVYNAGSSVYAIDFDPERLEVRGHPVPVLDGVLTRLNGSAEFQVSSEGTLVYVAGDARRLDPRVLAWVDRAGVEDVLSAEPRGYRAVRISPTGGQVAIELREPDSEIVIWDVARARLSSLTSTPGHESSPAWTPDGERVAFHSDREPQGIFWTRADGTGPVERLQSGAGAWPFSWSRDGRRLVVGTGGALAARDAALDVGVTDTTGDATIESLVATVSDERNAEISPDERWLAHESSESGRAEIYLRPFPDATAGRWAVSTAGGRQPVWSPDGGHLYFAAPDGTIMQAAVDASSELEIGEPTPLFTGPYAIGWAGRSFDVSPDGERFLMIRHDESTRVPANVVIVERWASELARRP